ncbi:hypothetical protein ACFV5N_24970 [Streptomyces sp. NPDC059853]|uniref:hypothetical protein n=1 Tax=Streptomyces sp. NPDC059853 TaxID=3346973 RepID=UPI003648B53F
MSLVLFFAATFLAPVPSVVDFSAVFFAVVFFAGFFAVFFAGAAFPAGCSAVFPGVVCVVSDVDVFSDPFPDPAGVSSGGSPAVSLATITAAPSHSVIVLAHCDRNDKSTPGERQRGRADPSALCPARPPDNRSFVLLAAPYTGRSERRGWGRVALSGSRQRPGDGVSPGACGSVKITPEPPEESPPQPRAGE